MRRITPFLWFEDQAEEAANFYTSIFDNSKVVRITRYSEGGAEFKFTPAISFFAGCETEEEIDELWRKLSDGGEILMPLQKYAFSDKFGWINDRFGVSWQIAPTALMEMLNDPDPQKSRRVTQAMLQMKKIDIQTLRQAHGQQ